MTDVAEAPTDVMQDPFIRELVKQWRGQDTHGGLAAQSGRTHPLLRGLPSPRAHCLTPKRRSPRRLRPIRGHETRKKLSP